jgi:hypothetical protein
MDRSQSVTPAQAAQFRSKVYGTLRLAAAARWGGVALAVVACAGAIGCLAWGLMQQRRTDARLQADAARYWADFYRPFLQPEFFDGGANSLNSPASRGSGKRRGRRPVTRSPARMPPAQARAQVLDALGMPQ